MIWQSVVGEKKKSCVAFLPVSAQSTAKIILNFLSCASYFELCNFVKRTCPPSLPPFFSFSALLYIFLFLPSPYNYFNILYKSYFLHSKSTYFGSKQKEKVDHQSNCLKETERESVGLQQAVKEENCIFFKTNHSIRKQRMQTFSSCNYFCDFFFFSSNLQKHNLMY